MNIGSCKHGTNITMHCHLCQREAEEKIKFDVANFKHQIESLTDNLASSMTKRETFAMAAMQGILANSHIAEILDKSPNKDIHGMLLKCIKERSYLMAELMLEEQQQGNAS